MKVKVTRKHIKNGQEGDCNNCPVALALREKFNLDEGDVQVDEDMVFLNFDTDYATESQYIIRRGTQFIQNFDNHVRVKPCTVELVPA